MQSWGGDFWYKFYYRLLKEILKCLLILFDIRKGHLLLALASKLVFYFPYHSRGHIGTGPQFVTCVSQTHREVTAFD